jgi:hypothetical protein
VSLSIKCFIDRPPLHFGLVIVLFLALYADIVIPDSACHDTAVGHEIEHEVLHVFMDVEAC